MVDHSALSDQLTAMMKTNVKMMQQQLEDGFMHIASRMGQLEARLSDNDQKIDKFSTNVSKEQIDKRRADIENRKLFQRMQEAIAGQQ